jgi:hypothetical protein
MFPFLRTYKPMLKRAWGTPSYQDVRQLLKQWQHCQHITQLLQHQNTRLYQAAHDRDQLLWEKHHGERPNNHTADNDCIVADGAQLSSS